MYSTNRLIRGELFKIFIRPAIFVMTLFLVVALIAGVLVFNPAGRTDSRFNINESSVADTWSTFNTPQYKGLVDNKKEQIFNLINFYKGEELIGSYVKPITTNMLKELLDGQKEKFKAINYALLLNIDEASKVTVLKNEMFGYEDGTETVKGLKDYCGELSYLAQNINQTYVSLYIDKVDLKELKRLTTSLFDEVAVDGNRETSEYYKLITDSIESNNFFVKIEKVIKKIKDIKINDAIISDASTKLSTAEAKCNLYYNEISNINQQAMLDVNLSRNEKTLATMTDLINKYKATMDMAWNIIYWSIVLDITHEKSFGQINNYSGDLFNNFNSYKAQELLTKNAYLFANEKFDFNYANVFQAGWTSNFDLNAYDFMYYILEFLSFIIIIFCVVLGAGMIAGESSGGTLKMLAIRPYKRSKILTSKIFATMIFGVVFLLISCIITFIIGINLFGLKSMPVLSIINGTEIIEMSALATILIYICTLLVRILVYTLLAVFISCVFKSNIAAVIISILIFFFVALIGNSLFGNSAIYQYIPFANLDFFKFFGGTFNNGGITNGAFGLQFTSPLLSDMNILFSAIVTLIFIIVIAIPTYLIFKKRDIE